MDAYPKSVDYCLWTAIFYGQFSVIIFDTREAAQAGADKFARDLAAIGLMFSFEKNRLRFEFRTGSRIEFAGIDSLERFRGQDVYNFITAVSDHTAACVRLCAEVSPLASIQIGRFAELSE